MLTERRFHKGLNDKAVRRLAYHEGDARLKTPSESSRKSIENHHPAFRNASSTDSQVQSSTPWSWERRLTATTSYPNQDYYCRRKTSIQRTEDDDDGKYQKEIFSKVWPQGITKSMKERNHTAATNLLLSSYYERQKRIQRQRLSVENQIQNYETSSTEDDGDGIYPKENLYDTWERGMTKPMKECRIMIVGACGTGKSSLGNTILGKRVFKTGLSASSVTRSFQEDSAKSFGRSITLVDTVGFNSILFTKSSLLNAFEKESPGPHAVLLTMSASERFTTESFSAIEQFVNLVGKEVYNYMVIVLTHADDLKKKQYNIRPVYKKCTSQISKISEMLRRSAH